MRFILFLTLFFLIEWYIFSALKVLMEGYRPLFRRTATLFYWGVSTGFILFLAYRSLRGEEALQNSPLIYLQSLFMMYYLSKTLLVAVLLIDDFRRLLSGWIPKLNAGRQPAGGRSHFLVRLALILASLPFFTLLYGKIRNTFRFKIFRIKVPIDHLSPELEGLRIVQISDIHSGSFVFKDPLIRAVDMINAQKPDLVLFTGDLVNDTAEEMDDFMDVLDKIKARYGVYSIFGNHDYGHHAHWPDAEAKSANMEKMKNVHRRLGWNLLLNEHRTLNIGRARLALIGVENYSVYERFPTYGRLDKASEGAREANVKILLSHDPSHWEAEVTKNYRDIQLTLSGHTHGSQFGVEIPGWIKWSPIKYMYKQWAGLYKEGNQYLYVNRGLGFIGYAGRVGILPEITVLELVRNKV